MKQIRDVSNSLKINKNQRYGFSRIVRKCTLDVLNKHSYGYIEKIVSDEDDKKHKNNIRETEHS